MRRRQGGRGAGGLGGAVGIGGGYPGGYSGARRCSVPTLKPLESALSGGIPCKSDTDLSGSGKSRLTSLQEEHHHQHNHRLSKSSSGGVVNPAASSSTTASPCHHSSGVGGGARKPHVSFYGATGLSASCASGIPFGRTAEFPGVDGCVNSKLRSESSSHLSSHVLYPPRAGSDYSLSSLNSSMASGSKIGMMTPHSVLVKSDGSQTQTHLSSLRGSTALLAGGGGDMTVVVAANGVGADGKVRI